MDIPGLFYIPDYLSPQEISDILLFLKTQYFKPLTNSKNSRQVLQYGYEYPYDKKLTKLNKITPIPENLLKLVDPARINKSINSDLLKNPMEQLIINKYNPGQGISAHTDHTKYFGDLIICLTVGSGTEINFIKNNQTKSLYLKPGSLYIMSGDARYKYQHEITGKLYDNNIKRLTRYSLTFRSVLLKNN